VPDFTPCTASGDAMTQLLRLLLATFLLFALNATAADFTLKDTQGHIHHLADYRGKWVLVNFWATWCAPCLEELPSLSALYNAHKDTDLIVIALQWNTLRLRRYWTFSRNAPYLTRLYWAITKLQSRSFDRGSTLFFFV